LSFESILVGYVSTYGAKHQIAGSKLERNQEQTSTKQNKQLTCNNDRQNSVSRSDVNTDY